MNSKPCRAVTAAIAAAAAITTGILAPEARAEPRTWTSASDASRTFEGELVAVSGSTVTVTMKDGSEKTFDLSVLSKADQDWVAANGSKLPPRVANAVADELRANLSRGTVAGGAEYYILYFASST